MCNVYAKAYTAYTAAPPMPFSKYCCAVSLLKNFIVTFTQLHGRVLVVVSNNLLVTLVKQKPGLGGYCLTAYHALYSSVRPFRGGATVLKVGGTILRGERAKKFFLTPHWPKNCLDS